MSKRYLIINTVPPYRTSTAEEALDMVLAISAFEQPLSVWFKGDGVFQLHKIQEPPIGSTHLSKFYGSKDVLDNANFYIEKKDLIARGLSIDDLITKVQLIDNAELSRLLLDQDIVLRF